MATSRWFCSNVDGWMVELGELWISLADFQHSLRWDLGNLGMEGNEEKLVTCQNFKDSQASSPRSLLRLAKSAESAETAGQEAGSNPCCPEIWRCFSIWVNPNYLFCNSHLGCIFGRWYLQPEINNFHAAAMTCRGASYGLSKAIACALLRSACCFAMVALVLEDASPMKSLRPICWPRIWKKWLGTLNAVIQACVKRK